MKPAAPPENRDQDLVAEASEQELSKGEEFSRTAKAARLSGAFHATVGSLKRKLGELTDDQTLQKAGRNQEVIGKIHKLVGAVREVREVAGSKLIEKRSQGAEFLRTHGGKFIDVATDCVKDIKKLF